MKREFDLYKMIFVGAAEKKKREGLTEPHVE